MFQPRFADLIVAGAKQQTIRPKRKRPILVGQPLSLRRWQGSPYRSKQQELRAEVCRKTYEIRIDERGLLWTGAALMPVVEMQRFAIADGFTNHADMVAWFTDAHGLPFSGVVISWAEEKR